MHATVRRTSQSEKLKTLIGIYDYDSFDDFARHYITDSIVPGICMNPGCEATYDYEPDQDEGWCEECDTNSVKSAFILAGII